MRAQTPTRGTPPLARPPPPGGLCNLGAAAGDFESWLASNCGCKCLLLRQEGKRPAFPGQFSVREDRSTPKLLSPSSISYLPTKPTEEEEEEEEAARQEAALPKEGEDVNTLSRGPAAGSRAAGRGVGKDFRKAERGQI